MAEILFSDYCQIWNLALKSTKFCKFNQGSFVSEIESAPFKCVFGTLMVLVMCKVNGFYTSAVSL